MSPQKYNFLLFNRVITFENYTSNLVDSVAYAIMRKKQPNSNLMLWQLLSQPPSWLWCDCLTITTMYRKSLLPQAVWYHCHYYVPLKSTLCFPDSASCSKTAQFFPKEHLPFRGNLREVTNSWTALPPAIAFPDLVLLVVAHRCTS